MWNYVFIFLLLLFVLWVLALNLDARFFNGRFLIKAKTTPKELKEELENALKYKTKPFEHWDDSALYWLHDFFLLVPILDNDLDEIRKPIVESLELHSEDEYLHADTVALIENAIKKLG